MVMLLFFEHMLLSLEQHIFPKSLGPMGPRAQGPMGPWAQGPKGPRAQGPMGPRPTGPRALGPGPLWRRRNAENPQNSHTPRPNPHLGRDKPVVETPHWHFIDIGRHWHLPKHVSAIRPRHVFKRSALACFQVRSRPKKHILKAWLYTCRYLDL